MRGDRLREARESRQMTQRELASRCGLGEKQIWRYENSESDPTGDVLTRIARELMVSVDYLPGLVDSPDQHLQDEDLTPLERRLLAAVRRGQIVEALETITTISKNHDQPVVPSQ